jgi:hypothetical protein
MTVSNRCMSELFSFVVLEQVWIHHIWRIIYHIHQCENWLAIMPPEDNSVIFS